MNISVIGLGKLGLCTAACFAAAGHRVTGYDMHDQLRLELRKGICPIDETGLPALLERAGSNLQIADSCREAVANSEITLIIVPTPSMQNGRFTNQYVVRVLEDLAPALQAKNEFHVVDVVSTVMPGSAEREFIPLLEGKTGKRCGIDFGLVYNPEFIALGSVVRDFLNPDMVLIGASDERSGNMVQELYTTTCVSAPSFQVMSLVNAEITKISLNCFVTMKISYANALAELCEQVPGADVDAVTKAVGADSRVGGKYLKGGLGFGGPCFPRDNIAFQAFAEEFGAEALLGKAVVSVNNSIPQRLLGRITAHCAQPAQVVLMGMSYKADTHIVEESQAVMLAQLLLDTGYSVTVHDPRALGAVRQVLGDAVSYCSDPYQAAVGAKAIILLTDWPEYRELDWTRIAAQSSAPCLLLDAWRTAHAAAAAGLLYCPVGVHTQLEAQG
ncbi:UDP-glucose dehydrogenase family protein [Trichlorobacter lovleyi]|uniref:UDP-glucose dehydrogenase family protein n=1 Tax=Trichlorobacter lovleyi TaxID=313985 RepID=UPI0023F12C6A|nr:nucleotide sugar dehydrogenase [Trichlorobacter lovleyi]